MFETAATCDATAKLTRAHDPHPAPSFLFLLPCSQTTLNKLKGRVNQRLELVNPKKTSKKGYTNSGELTIVQCDMTRVYSLMDYLSGGCEINLVVAIDYTASNGNPAYPTSLHYINPYEPNEYMKAIKAVGTVLAAYDADKQFPVRRVCLRSRARQSIIASPPSRPRPVRINAQNNTGVRVRRQVPERKHVPRLPREPEPAKRTENPSARRRVDAARRRDSH